MCKSVARALIGVLLSYCALGSEPGQPFDCTDWQIVEPGITCQDLIRFPCTDAAGNERNPCIGSGEEYDKAIDNTGDLLWVERTCPEGLGRCGPSPANSNPRCRTQIVALTGGAQRVIAYADDRCCPEPGDATCVDFLGPQGLEFDDKNGRLIVPLNHSCTIFPPLDCPRFGHSLIQLSGFATTFEVLQTYDPGAKTLGFRVPAMPEGLAGVDFFDSFWGHLTSVPDFSEAQPLRCRFPTAPPRTGDYLTVPDTVLGPAPGECIYFVTAATFGGDRRWGRSAAGGLFHGRDPAALPECGR